MFRNQNPLQKLLQKGFEHKGHIPKQLVFLSLLNWRRSSVFSGIQELTIAEQEVEETLRWIGSNVGIYLDVPLKVGMNGEEMGCKLLLNGVYRGYNPLTIFPNFLKHPTKG